MPGEKTPLVGFAGDGPKRKKGNGITCLLIILFVLLLVFIALSATFISLYIINSRAAVTEPCITSTCISLTQEILGSIDESVSPCNDFYNFACGRWERTHALEPGTRTGAALCVQHT